MKKQLGLLLAGVILCIKSISQIYQPLEDQRLGTGNSVLFNQVTSQNGYYISSADNKGYWLRNSDRTYGTYFNGSEIVTRYNNNDYAQVLSSTGLSVYGNAVLHSGNFNNYAPTLTGVGASGNWNINAARWGGRTADFSGFVNGGIAWLTGALSDGSIRPWLAQDVKAFLDLPSAGETLQSITDRGNSTSHDIQITGNGRTIYTNNGYLQVGSSGPYPIFLASGGYYQGGNTGITIATNNNVGIGTTSPAYKLDVNGNGRIGPVYFTNPVSEQGAYIGWNDDGGGGMTYFKNQRGGGIGGFVFQESTTDNVRTDLMRIASNGNVGIGTTSPSQKLEVSGKILANANDGGFQVKRGVNHNEFLTGENGELVFYQSTSSGFPIWIKGNANVGIGTTSPVYKLDVNGEGNVASFLNVANNLGGFTLGNAAGRNRIAYGSGILSNTFRLLTSSDTYANLEALGAAFSGDVVIGTNEFLKRLSVNGDIKTRKIKVTQTEWSDYVFDSSYQLAPLHQVEKFIQTNKHLPEVPSAAEVKKDGLDLGDNQAVLLKKIEELTLYIIQQNKELSRQNKELAEQNKKIEIQGQKLKELESRIK